MIKENNRCEAPVAEYVSPTARVMINICHALGHYFVPKGDYEGTNLEGLSGKPLEELTVSDLEKVTLLAAGFMRPEVFIRKRTGTLVKNSLTGGWDLCSKMGQTPINTVIASTLKSGSDLVGIRITPKPEDGGESTKPNRPYQSISTVDSPKFKYDEKHQIIGLNQSQDSNGKFSDPYTFKPGDTVEIFIDPRPDKRGETTLGGGLIISFSPNGNFNASVTKDGVNIRNVFDSNNEEHREQILGNLNDDYQKNVIIRKFIQENAFAINRLIAAVAKCYPDTEELNIEANYAHTKTGWNIYGFDMEIPKKIRAQWVETYLQHILFLDGYNEEALQSHNPTISRNLELKYRRIMGD